MNTRYNNTYKGRPFFSVVIPTYNRERSIGKAIQSVIDQTFMDWELIVVDDGSTDNTRDMVSVFGDKRIRYVYQANAKSSAARNRGIEMARGTYICFLDSDDNYLENHLERLFLEISSRGFPIAFFYSLVFQITPYRSGIVRLPEAYPNPIRAVVSDYRPPSSSVCIHRTILTKYKFDPSFRLVEDAELWARIVMKYPMYKIDEPTVEYHLSQDSLTMYSLPYLQGMEDAWTRILAVKAYQPLLPKGFKSKMLCRIFSGLADMHADNGDRTQAFKYLLQTFRVKPSKLMSREFWGIFRKTFKEPEITPEGEETPSVNTKDTVHKNQIERVRL